MSRLIINCILAIWIHASVVSGTCRTMSLTLYFDIREVQLYLNPEAEHYLHWFRIPTRLTLMGQYGKGLDTNAGEARGNSQVTGKA